MTPWTPGKGLWARGSLIVAAVLALVIVNVIGWGAVVAAADRSGERIHRTHHVTGDRPCGCAIGVEEMRAEIATTADDVAAAVGAMSQRLDAIESRCVWLGPHRVPVMRVGK